MCEEELGLQGLSLSCPWSGRPGAAAAFTSRHWAHGHVLLASSAAPLCPVWEALFLVFLTQLFHRTLRTLEHIIYSKFLFIFAFIAYRKITFAHFFIWFSLKFMIRKCQLLYLKVEPGVLQVTLHNESPMPPILHCKSHIAVPQVPEASGLS